MTVYFGHREDTLQHDTKSFMSLPDGRNGVGVILPRSKKQTRNTRKLALVGIMCKAGDVDQRAMLRFINRDIVPDEIDVSFIVGLPSEQWEKDVLYLEMKQFDDVVLLPNEPENLNEGKTYAFFKHVHDSLSASVRPYDFVMKTDADSFVHYRNLLKRFKSLPRENVYYGLGCGQFMCGMGYALTWDLVQKISTSSFAAKHKKGPEDIVTGGWINHFDKEKRVKRVADNRVLVEFPDADSPWARPYATDQSVVHKLKNLHDLMQAARFYVLDKHGTDE